MIPSESVDVVISNCVLNLVRHHKKHQLFQEIFRVLKVGGRCVISDIVCDEDVPMALQGDADLWSGCVSGALREDLFVKAFDDAGLYGMHIIERSEAPWRTIEGIEFRAVTVAAYKGKQGPCLERNQAVIYKGPWRRVVDDDGHALDRGQRTAVCDKTFTLYQREPYRDHFYFVEPLTQIPPEAARPFDCHAGAARRPRESKGLHYDVTSERPAGCRLEGCCESTYGTMNENT